MDKGMQALAYALLPYSYAKKSDDGKKMVLCAGNGAEVTFEKLSSNPTVVSLSAEEGNEWAIRQVAHILQGHPAFEFIDEPHDETPWRIQLKESAVKHMCVLREALLRENERLQLSVNSDTWDRMQRWPRSLQAALKRALRKDMSGEREAAVRFALDIARHIVGELGGEPHTGIPLPSVRIDDKSIKAAWAETKRLKTALKQMQKTLQPEDALFARDAAQAVVRALV